MQHVQKLSLIGGIGLALMTVLGVPELPRAQALALIGGDLNHDGDVDVNDVALFIGCMSGSGLPHNGSDLCDEADLDHDGDVDVGDFGLIQACLTGPNIPGNPACGGCVRPRSNRAISLTSTLVYANDYTFVNVANSQQGVNYQLRNNANNSNIGTPVAGTGEAITLSSGPLTAATTFNVLAINAVQGCSVQLAGTVTVTVRPYVPHNKIGVHSIIGARTGYGPFVTSLANAGKPVAVVKCVDDFGPAGEAKQACQNAPACANGPYQTLTIGRVNEINGNDLQGLDYLMRQGMTGAQGAAWYYNQVKPKWLQNPSIDVWETCNEWSNWGTATDITRWQGDFYMAFMDLAEADGYRLGLWAASVGNPPTFFYPEFARTCARAKAHGNHILTLHEYGFFTDMLKDCYEQNRDAEGYGTMVLRYRRLYNYLKQQNADCPLALTEVGQGNGCCFVGIQPFVDDHAWYDAQLRQDPYVIGYAAWTLGSWAGANFQNALPNLTSYILSQP